MKFYKYMPSIKHYFVLFEITLIRSLEHKKLAFGFSHTQVYSQVAFLTQTA